MSIELSIPVQQIQSIPLTSSHIGRTVIYDDGFNTGKGKIVRFTEQFVFVDYGVSIQATPSRYLTWYIESKEESNEH